MAAPKTTLASLLPLWLVFCSSFGHASQPGASPPYKAPLRELPWGQLNFLHTTDLHGWLGGHMREPSFSADWGDYISFAQHLRDRADATDSDMLLVDTGDRIEGNGLYDASDPRGKYYFDILKQQNIDVITVGNHELYKAQSAIDELRKTVPDFGQNYVASNLDIRDPETGEWVPLASRYRKFRTKNLNLTLTTFGFLFDFTGNAKNTLVRPVEDVIRETWFQESIREDVDVFLVIGHAPPRGREFRAVLKEIRVLHPETPVVFFGGHLHVRDYAVLDEKAVAMESGRYMETIGFLSMTGQSTAPYFQGPLEFGRRYMDNNIFSMHHHSQKNDSTFRTPLGERVTEMIKNASQHLGLTDYIGCVPRSFYINRAPYPHSSRSIYTWLADQVLPDQLARRFSEAQVHDDLVLAITNTGAIRFDLFHGPFTRGTKYLVSPFTSGFRHIPNVPFDIASQVLPLLNGGDQILDRVEESTGLKAELLAPLGQRRHLAQQRRPSALATSFHSFDTVSLVGEQVPLQDSRNGEGDPPRVRPGYTTIDDVGDDGDDTVHSPMAYFEVPNCIQAPIEIEMPPHTPRSVDLVYNEFVQPWILEALNFLGMHVNVNDTDVFLPGETLTKVISDWVESNWHVNPGACEET